MKHINGPGRRPEAQSTLRAGTTRNETGALPVPPRRRKHGTLSPTLRARRLGLRRRTPAASRRRSITGAACAAHAPRRDWARFDHRWPSFGLRRIRSPARAPLPSDLAVRAAASGTLHKLSRVPSALSQAQHETHLAGDDTTRSWGFSPIGMRYGGTEVWRRLRLRP